MNQPLVTAIITTHNRLELLKRAIESIQNQTYQNIELIVVDDASDDGTKEYCSNLSVKYIYIPKDECAGSNHARNIGLRYANGLFIAYCDDDDYWLPTKIEKQVELIQHKECDFVHCAYRKELVNPNGSVSYSDCSPADYSEGDVSKASLCHILTLTSTVLFRKSAVIEAGGFDEALKAWQETELIIRIAQHSKTYFVREPLVVYRVDTSDTQRLTNKYFNWKLSVKYIHKKHKKLYASLSFKEKCTAYALVAADGIGRAKASGLTAHWYYNILLLKIFSLFGE